MKNFILTIILLINSYGFSQQTLNNFSSENNKGKIYFYWGWNRSLYSKSDISFAGDDYNFSLDNVKATDRPTDFGLIYFNPGTITIPQFNFRIGYFIKDHYSISLGSDHMKYIVTNNQTVPISGKINTGTAFDGKYNNQPIILTENFLKFEHTDGLNYINIDFRRFDNLFKFKKISINITEGLGAGIIYPRTNTTLLNKERYDEFHLSGYGINLVGAINFTFFDCFFIQSEAKAGYIDMPNIRTTKSVTGNAAQNFFFSQFNLVFGASINLNKK